MLQNILLFIFAIIGIGSVGFMLLVIYAWLSAYVHWLYPPPSGEDMSYLHTYTHCGTIIDRGMREEWAPTVLIGEHEYEPTCWNGAQGSFVVEGVPGSDTGRPIVRIGRRKYEVMDWSKTIEGEDM